MTTIPNEAVHAAREAYVKELPETALYPSEFAMRAAISAALPHLAKPVDGERHEREIPVGWTWRLDPEDKWQYIDGAEKPRLGLPTGTEERVTYRAVYTALGAGTVAQEPVGWFNPPNDQHGYQQVSPEFEGGSGTIPLYATPQPAAVAVPEVARAFKLGDRVQKRTGSSWNGRVVGFYSTKLTPVGYAVESEREPGSVQIYPEGALTAAPSPVSEPAPMEEDQP